MAEDEALREALIELDALRQREATALRESNALVTCLSAVATSPTPEAALANLLKAINDAVECAIVAIIGEVDGNAEVLVATDSTLIGLPAPTDLMKGHKPRRVVSLRDANWWPISDEWPDCLLYTSPSPRD